MSHCALEATVKPIHFHFVHFIPVICNAFVTQVCWEAVPNTWPGSSKASITKCFVCVEPHTICRWTSGADV